MLHDASVSLDMFGHVWARFLEKKAREKNRENLWDTYKYSRDKVMVFSGGPGLWASWWSLRAVLLGDFCGSSGFLVRFFDVFQLFNYFSLAFLRPSRRCYRKISQVSLEP